MKFRITLKDPDGVFEGLREATDQAIREAFDPSSDVEVDPEEAIEEARESINDFTKQWITYGEYVTIEFDTEANTAVVIKKS